MISRRIAAIPVAVLVSAAMGGTAGAQSAPAPQPSSTPSVYGLSFGVDDPCTSLSAIVSRPTVANSVCTVKPGHIELETGYQNVSSPAGNQVAYPQGAIRVGTMLPRLELQVSPPGGARSSTGGSLVTGLTDAGAGLKYLIGFTPKASYSVQINATIPSGTAAFSAASGQVFASLQGSYAISPVFGFTAMAQQQWLSNGQQRWSSFVPALDLTAGLGRTTLFTEAAQFTQALGPDGATRTQLLLGVSQTIGTRVQLDLETTTSPTAATGRYHGIGFGFSAYF